MAIKYKMGLTFLALLLLGLAQQGVVDRFGMHYTESGFKRALVTFAVARSLNGVISVAQGTEVAVQPAGVGINFTPGQILDPVNDLIERFSWVMLASTTSLGLQKVLLKIFSSLHYTVLLAAVMLMALLLLWRRHDGGGSLFLYRAMLVLLVLRFAVPLVALGSEFIFTTFLQQQYEESTQNIEQARDDIGRINKGRGVVTLPKEESFVGRAKEWYRATLDSIDFESTLEEYQQAAAHVSEQFIQLIVIFVLQTVLLPLLFLWGFGRLLRRVWQLPRPW